MNLIEQIHLFDQKLTLAINSIHTTWSDQLWQFFSAKDVWFLMYAIVAVALVVRLGWKKGVVAILSIIATIVVCDQLSNLVKDAVQRLRPCHDPFMLENGLRVLEGKANRFGFFSAHAANAFGFALSSLLCFRMDKRTAAIGYGTWIIVWATLVSLSRIFVGKHYLGDVLVGSIVGILVGWALAKLACRLVTGKMSSRRGGVRRTR